MVYLISALTTLTSLSWSQEKPQFRPLPSHIKRIQVSSPNGNLELLVCTPIEASQSDPLHPPLFFVHGGYGSAGVWIEWMSYLHNTGYTGTLYAYSARNHGASYTLPYWRMVWGTSFQDILDDAVICLTHANNIEQSTNSLTRDAVLIGHSSGGGVSQALLNSGTIKASGLALVDAIPSYGSYDIYWNWLKHDPWFPIRSWLHLQHPTSPLSTDELVHRAFFGHKYPLKDAKSFRSWMPKFETMGWSSAMLGNSFWKWITGQNEWLACEKIVHNIDHSGKDKICVIIGKEDMMYRSWMWERQVREYQNALALRSETIGSEQLGADTKASEDLSIHKVYIRSQKGVHLILVQDSGHHVQNDVYCDQAAEGLLRWVQQV